MSKKKKVFSFEGFDQAHYMTTEAYAKAIDSLYNKAVDDFSRMASRLNVDPSKPFSFSDYPTAKIESQRITSDLAGKIYTVITEGSRKQWLYANEKNDAFLDSILDTSKISEKLLKKYQDRNLDALAAFQGRKTDGLGLSDRVWNYASQFKDQMELGIDIGLGDGKSAQTLSQDLRQYLVDPDKLFRRVRDKHGNLQLSKKAKAFHPGQGKYRSSYKNAMRLTRSEINMSYRESDHLRWLQLDFVSGYEVKLSNRHRITDICDVLVGKYPKTFKFTGWHPQCMCHAIPILMPIDEFFADTEAEIRADVDGTEYEKYSASNTVTDVPKSFRDWVEQNREAAKGWKSTPYFVRDNFEGGDLSGGLSYTPEHKPTQTAPKATFVSKIPSLLQKGSDYLKGTSIEFKEEFFQLIDENRPVKLEIKSKGGSYHSLGEVTIENGSRNKSSNWEKEAVVYHEYGHAIDYQRGLKAQKEVETLMSMYKKQMNKKADYTRFERVYDYNSMQYKYKRTTSKVSEFYSVDDRLNQLTAKIFKINNSVFEKLGISKYDVLEQIGSARDTIMALNSNYGFGHTKAYFKLAGKKEAEFIAHCFENKFAGNSVFKKYMPELYEDMIKYIDAIQ